MAWRFPNSWVPSAGSGEVSFSDVVISGDPDYEAGSAYTGASGIFDSLTDHGAGEYSFSLNNNVAVDGINEGVAWIVPMPPEFVDDGTWGIAFEITVVSGGLPAGNANAWVIGAVVDDAGDPTSATRGLGGGVRQLTTTTAQPKDASLTAEGVAAGDTTLPATFRVDWIPGGVQSDGDALGTIVSTHSEFGTQTSRAQGSTDGNGPGLLIAAGCDNATDNGPHVLRARIRVGAYKRGSA